MGVGSLLTESWEKGVPKDPQFPPLRPLEWALAASLEEGGADPPPRDDCGIPASRHRPDRSGHQ
jgi:hypothetical protein